MAHSPSPEHLSDADAAVLLDLADTTLARALIGDRPELPALHDLPPGLHRTQGAFVTLKVAGELNGCIGTLDGDEPLGHAIPRLALSAAFADHRLPPLRVADYDRLTIEVSLLSPLEPMAASSREDLLAELRPGHDGLVVKANRRQGLFLPAVWDQLPRPEDFLDHLWHKAGLVPRTWPAGTQTYRFTARKLERDAGRGALRAGRSA